jgi:hypothetical protein
MGSSSEIKVDFTQCYYSIKGNENHLQIHCSSESKPFTNEIWNCLTFLIRKIKIRGPNQLDNIQMQLSVWMKR